MNTEIIEQLMHADKLLTQLRSEIDARWNNMVQEPLNLNHMCNLLSALTTYVVSDIDDTVSKIRFEMDDLKQEDSPE